MYFTEVIQLNVEQNRSFNILIDGQDYQLSIAPQYQIYDELVRTTSPAMGMMNISIAPSKNSTLPPVISAAEIYTVSDTLKGGTNGGDDIFLVMDWKALQVIDLHNNHLTGTIPDFLGKLPNLKTLVAGNPDITQSPSPPPKEGKGKKALNALYGLIGWAIIYTSYGTVGADIGTKMLSLK
ncbi:hypothetical protein QJS10_CPB20g00831 [Acorus calamus]|uniref:Malectin-like domain-containing protein n=1 Tax=Acorus calamus TaxID=4465 RepID=A0AAV9CDX6_ACOCL|nr:hypothetical protein QJS10_CPB20g00831 [Acorus calamus]